MTTCLQTSVLNVPLGYVLSDSIYDLHEFHFTVEAWVLPQNGGVIVTNKAAGGGNSEYGGFTFSVSTDGRLRLSEDNGFAYYAVNSVPITRLFDGNWHHVAGMRHFPDLSLYVDGEQVTVQVDNNGSSSSMDLQQAGPFGVACNPSYNTMSEGTAQVHFWPARWLKSASGNVPSRFRRSRPTWGSGSRATSRLWSRYGRSPTARQTI